MWAKEALLRRPTRVIVCGGDGTMMRTITALYRGFPTLTQEVASSPELPPVPPLILCHAGTVGTIRRNMGYRIGPRQILRDALSNSRSFEEVRTPTLSITIDGMTLTAFTLGAGLVVNFFDEYYGRERQGLWTATRIAVRTFVGAFFRSEFAERILSRTECTLSVDGHPLQSSAYSLVVCSVLRDLGLGIRITYRGGEDPMHPHLIASALKASALARQWPRTLRGLPLRGPGDVDRQPTGFSLEFPDEGKVIVDGDALRGRSVSVRAGPIVRLLVA